MYHLNQFLNTFRANNVVRCFTIIGDSSSNQLRPIFLMTEGNPFIKNQVPEPFKIRQCRGRLQVFEKKDM